MLAAPYQPTAWISAFRLGGCCLKRESHETFKLALVVAGILLASLASAQAAVETYDIDPVHTWVGFTIAHFFTKVPGFSAK